MDFTFVPDWRRVLTRAWSARLIVVGATLTGLSQLLPLADGISVRGTFIWIPPTIPLWLGIAGYACTLAALPARIIRQPKLH